MSAIETEVDIRTFRDESLEARFRRDGFVVVDLCPPETVDALKRAYEELDSGIDAGYYPSLMSPNLDYKAETHVRVRDLVWPLLSEVLIDYQPLLGVFMVKHPGEDTEVPPHRDWIIADESRRPSMTMWMPLTPLTPETGEMRMLAGSHRWLEGLRGSPTFPTQWDQFYDQVRDELMEPVRVEVGQAVIYDIRILHGTPANTSGETRVVTSLYAIPEGEKPIHYYRSPEGDVVGYRVPENFCTVFDIGDVPDGEKFIEIPNYTLAPLTFDEMAARHVADRKRYADGS